MCGGCGERAAHDWARPFLAGLPARMAVAAALARLAPGPAPRVTAGAGGWLVSAPTGRQTACTGLVELVAAHRPWLRSPGPFDPRHASGRLMVPPPDNRRGVLVRVAAGSPEQPGFPKQTGISAHAELPERVAEVVLVPDAAAARRAVVTLAGPRWSARAFLAGLSGVAQPWAAEPAEVGAGAEEQAADLLVWAEHARQSGVFDDNPVVLRGPLRQCRQLDVELRAGQVVRARALPAAAAAHR